MARPITKKECLYPLCDRKRAKRLWCNTHYIQQRKYGFESMKSSTPFETCVYGKCDRKPFSRALCNKHYRYIYQTGIPDNPDRVVNPKIVVCSVVSCEGATRRSLMCSGHEALCRKYNLSSIQFSTLLIKQNFRCKICGEGDIKLFVDHDHSCCYDKSNRAHHKSCGKCNRGLVCSNCNFGLAAFRDNPQIMQSAVEYLGKTTDLSVVEDSMGLDSPGSRLWQCRWYKYKIGPNRFEYMMELLDKKCPICRFDFDEVHMDHCHKTGAFRMPLCRSCNHGLGHVKDNPKTLLSMIQYIERYKMEMVR